MNGRRTERSGETEIDLKKLFRGLLRKAWLIGLVSVICALAVLVGTILFVSPEYESSVMFYVNNSSVVPGEGAASISSADISASRGLVKSYIVILTSRESLDGVIEHADVDCTYEELKKMITAEVVDSAEFFRVVVTSSDPEEADRIADAISYILPNRIAGIIEGTSAKLVDFAMAGAKPDSPNYVKNTVIGFALGLIASVGAVALWTIMDRTIRTVEDAEQCCEYPVLAVIPDRAGRGRPEPIGPELSAEALQEYKRLRTKLKYSFPGEVFCPVIGISGLARGAGKCMTAVNLAYSLSRSGKKGIVIDCDVRDPGLAEKLNLQKTPGLSDFLTGQCSLEQMIQPCGLLGQEDAFSVVTAGQAPADPAELLSSEGMGSLLKELRDSYDYVILELPPVTEVSDGLDVAADADGFLLALRQDHCSSTALVDAVDQLEFVNAKILGLVYSGAPGRKNLRTKA